MRSDEEDYLNPPPGASELNEYTLADNELKRSWKPEFVGKLRSEDCLIIQYTISVFPS
jgi:hypothetical protein